MQAEMKPIRISKISAAMASVAAASQAESAVAQPPAQPVAGATTVSVEGFIAFSNFSNSVYPAGAVPFIPQSLNKVGSPPQGSGNLYPGWQTGGYGSPFDPSLCATQAQFDAEEIPGEWESAAGRASEDDRQESGLEAATSNEKGP